MKFTVSKRRKLPDYISTDERGKYAEIYDSVFPMSPGTHCAVSLDTEEETKLMKSALSAKGRASLDRKGIDGTDSIPSPPHNPCDLGGLMKWITGEGRRQPNMRLYQVLHNGHPAGYLAYNRYYKSGSLHQSFLEAKNHAVKWFASNRANSIRLNMIQRYHQHVAMIRSVEIPDEVYFAPEDKP